MLELEIFEKTLFTGLIILFVLSQSAYFINNIVADLVIFSRQPQIVDESKNPDIFPIIHILIPLYEEPREIINETLEGLLAQEYPTTQLKAHLIKESTDPVVNEYIDDLVADFEATALEIDCSTVDRDIVASYLDRNDDDFSGISVPRTKASAIKYAFRMLGLPPDHVLTVFDADTLVPPDTFRLAVSGLESYDVVQAKQTVRNHGDGWLPRLEAMGMAGWCHAIYAKTTKGPYQLLGKAYFFRVIDLWKIDDWEVDAITEDLTLGITAYNNGYSLGVIDRYVQDICPSDFSDWISQKRRWVAGPYPYLNAASFDLAELVRFWAYSGLNQVISVLNVVGVPAGILYILFVVAGYELYNSPPLIVITMFNLANWVYFSIKTYQATIRGIQFTSATEALKFYLASNPFTQLVYSMVWAIPISLAIWDITRGGKHNANFKVTPKTVQGSPNENFEDTVDPQVKVENTND